MNFKQYLLVKIAEECSEIAQAAIKCSLFGFDSKDPREENGYNNLQKMLIEVLDLHAVSELLEKEIDNHYADSVFPEETFDSVKYISNKKVLLKHYWNVSLEKNKDNTK